MIIRPAKYFIFPYLAYLQEKLPSPVLEGSQHHTNDFLHTYKSNFEYINI